MLTQNDLAVGHVSGGEHPTGAGLNGGHFGGNAIVAVPLVPADVAAAGAETHMAQRLHRRLRRHHLH